MGIEIKFKIGETYPMKNGNLVKILSYDGRSSTFPMTGWDAKSGSERCFTLDGAWGWEPNEKDLVAPVDKPKTPQVGQTYPTRGGWTAVVDSDKGAGTCKYLGRVTTEDGEYSETWDERGSVYSNGGEDEADLLLNPEPAQEVVFINKLSNRSCFETYETATAAVEAASDLDGVTWEYVAKRFVAEAE